MFRKVTRTHLIHLVSYINTDFFVAKGYLTSSQSAAKELSSLPIKKGLRPLDSFGMFKKRHYQIRVTLKAQDRELLSYPLESDDFGVFQVRIPRNGLSEICEGMRVEVTLIEGKEERPLGETCPIILHEGTSILFSDFDKTLCETHFHGIKDLIKALKTPLTRFPTLEQSLKLVKEESSRHQLNFILTASPHFFLAPIKQWLLRNELEMTDIILKDYRRIFSWEENLFTLKDMKNQGVYKLNQIIDHMKMIGLPCKLTMVGDAYEADTFIYCLVVGMMTLPLDPWQIWKEVRHHPYFQLTPEQDSQILRKLYWLKDEVKKRPRDFDLNVHIRTIPGLDKEILKPNFYSQLDQSIFNYYPA